MREESGKSFANLTKKFSSPEKKKKKNLLFDYLVTTGDDLPCGLRLGMGVIVGDEG